MRPERTFCTVFPAYKDFHFYKDPGQVPYRFSRFGYKSSLVCYARKKDLPETAKYLRIICFPGNYLTRKLNIAVILFLLLNARKIDILNTFHLTWDSLLFVFLYKALNRKGFAYLKLDNCSFSGPYPWEADLAGERSEPVGRITLKRRVKSRIAARYFVMKVDLFSVEDQQSRDVYEQKYRFFRGKLITVFNGHTSDLPGSAVPCGFEEKEDIILTAGRLGTYQKATEVLLDAFRTVAAHSVYNLHLAGPVETSFRKHMDDYFNSDPSLKERVIFHGALGRDELYDLYCRSKIFCMSSRYEGMALVFPEAMYYGNAIVTTWPVSVKQIIEESRAGIVVEKDDPNALAKALLVLINDSDLILETGQSAHETSATLFNWENIIPILIKEIEFRINREKDKA